MTPTDPTKWGPALSDRESEPAHTPAAPPDAWSIEIWNRPDSDEDDEHDETTWAVEEGESPEDAKQSAIRQELRYRSRVPHRMTIRPVYYGPREDLKVEVVDRPAPSQEGSEP